MGDKSEGRVTHTSDGAAAVPGRPTRSGVGVLDRAMAVFDAILAAREPLTLADLVAATGLPRATAHRLAVALVDHGMLRRSADGRFGLGLRLIGIGHAVAGGWPLAELAGPALAQLRDRTGESVQLYVRDGEQRVCLVSLESTHELRTIVAQGARLPLDRGSAGRALQGPPVGAARWVESRGERAPGVGSVSAPVVDPSGAVVAAVGISGPLDRLGADAGPRLGPEVVAAADQVATALAR
jgi:DNA-binding IclR family transcriptional regulator